MNINYIFVCIGTNKIISDSFGPRVGEKLKKEFYNRPEIKIFGTMIKPIHFNNAPLLLNKLKKYNEKVIILIDSAVAKNEKIGNTYMSLGGIEIGRALGKSLYFPANINIKTIVGNERKMPRWDTKQIDNLATLVTTQITSVIKEII